MTNQSWCILRTKPSATLRLAGSLASAGFDVWTPVEIVQPVPGLKRKGPQAMIPRYVFAKGHHADELLSMSYGRHRHAQFHLVMIADRVARVRDANLQQLRDAETMSVAMSVPRKHMSPYSRGSRVRITRGGCTGMSATVETSDGREAKVWVTMFGRHTRFTLPLFALEDDAMKIAA
jgi:transcription antitermination factor NusG